MRTPILVMAYNRPSTTKRLIDTIEGLPRRNILVSVDGAKLEHAVARQQTMDIFAKWSNESVHEISIIDRPSNLGLYDHFMLALENFFTLYPVGIVLEDDIEFSPTFVEFVDNQTKILEDEVWSICGNNPLPNHDLMDARHSKVSFHKTNIHTISGWAASRNSYETFKEFASGSKNSINAIEAIRNFVGKVSNDPLLKLGLFTVWQRKLERALRKDSLGSWDNWWEIAAWSSGRPSLIPEFSLSRESLDQSEGQAHHHVFSGVNWSHDRVKSVTILDQISPVHRQFDISLLEIWGVRRKYCWIYSKRIYSQYRTLSKCFEQVNA